MQLQRLKNIYWLRFDCTKEMCQALMRIQEAWESKRWAGKVFSNRKYNQWYSKKYHTQYATEVCGMNFPVRAIVPFQMGIYDPLSGAERAFIEWLEIEDYNAYFIATGNDNDAFYHEAAHALYNLNTEYRTIADRVTGRTNLGPLKKYMKWCDYTPAVWKDEAQAFIIDDLEFLEEHDITGMEAAHSALRKAFNKYWKETV